MQFNFRFFSTSLLISLISLGALGQQASWGWNGHRYINEHAVEYLPPEMAFWIEHTEYLRDHATDPDSDSDPGEYHYINIDYYPEFFEGTLPHDYDELVDLYDATTVFDEGVVPWIVEEWTLELRDLMADGEWDDVWQVAAELGHYVADSHQPLHLTENYDGDLTGNEGIHARYESWMINDHLDDIALTPGEGEYWPNVLDSTFNYIYDLYPYLDEIIAADDAAYAVDDDYEDDYYDVLWEETEELTNVCMNRAVRDLASVWITAWLDAGSPLPNNIAKARMPIQEMSVFPNPSSDICTVELTLDGASDVVVQVVNQLGQVISTPYSGYLSRGTSRIILDNSDTENGVYLIRITTDAIFTRSTQVVVVK